MTKSPYAFRHLIMFASVLLLGCNEKNSSVLKANDVIPIFKHFNLILGDGSNVGPAINYENKDYFFATQEGEENWVVFKTPNAGNTHGTSNNTRTELAQLKKWPPMVEAKLEATLKVSKLR